MIMENDENWIQIITFASSRKLQIFSALGSYVTKEMLSHLAMIKRCVGGAGAQDYTQ